MIRHVNPSAVARYGWRSAATAVGLSAAVLGEGLPEHLGSGTWRGELRATGGSGGTFLAAFDVSPFHGDDGAVEGSLVVCLDASRRVEAERVAERLARLQAVTARLGGARSLAEVAAAVCDHSAAGVGAQSAIFMRLVDDGATFEIVRQIGYTAAIESEFGRFSATADLPAGDAIRFRTIIFLADEADRDARYPHLVGQPMNSPAHAVVPMIYDDRAVGAIGFGFRRPRQLDDDDRRFLFAVASQAAQALDRARVDEEERTARRRQELLARATGVLAGSFDPVGMATMVGRLAVQELADSFSVHVIDGDTLRTLATVNADPVLEELMADLVPASPGSVLVRYLDGLVSSGRSLLVPSIAPGDWDDLLDDARAADAVRALDVASAIVVGLHSRGNRIGVVAATRRSGRVAFDQDDFVVVVELASRLAAALDNAAAHHTRVEVTRTLQASLLPPRLPHVPGVALAARYDPVGDGSLVGGDFYDAFPIGADRWGLVLGDVCGQGVPAAALTSLVRYTVRAAARVWQSPAEVLRFTNDAILDHDTGERFCTLLVCVLRQRPEGVAVTLAAAGHHLPLHAPKDGVPVPVGQTGTALGLIRQPEIADSTIIMGVGDLLVLTTDGVIEARDPQGQMVAEDFLDGLVAAHAGEGAEAVASAVERATLAVGGGRAGDDIAVLVVEVTGGRDVASGQDATVERGPFDRRFPVEAGSATAARRSVAEWLEAQDVRGARVPDLLLALTELVTNAVRSARTAVEVRCWLTAGAITLEVTDDGPGFDPTIPRDARDLDPLAERGRGLFLVAALVDECTIESGPNGSIVRCFLVP
jgi:serine phosphatase RsbU (regulator of sigma subunit)/anti-sigma regulatory factor (Ser/Thr protein kinase)